MVDKELFENGEVIEMADQKGLNKNRNHHDSLSNSGSKRIRNDIHANNSIFDAFRNVGSGKQNPYGQGKHSKGGKKKQFHW